MSGSIWAPGNPASLALTLVGTQTNTPAQVVTINLAQIIGSLLYMQGKIAFSAAGTGGIAINITFALSPSYVVAAAAGIAIGQFVYQTAGTTRYEGSVILGTNNTLYFLVNAATSQFGVNPAVTIANGDYIVFSCMVPLG